MAINNNAKPFFSASVLNVLVFILYVLCILPACIFAFKKPQYNWDMLPYMAIVIKMDHSNINNIHAITYQTAKANIPIAAYRSLTDSSNAYRKEMFQNPVSFYEQLPFYTIKPLYTGFVYILYKCGLALTQATVLPSIIGYLLSSLLLFFWIKKYLKLPIAFILSIVTAYSIFMIGTAQTSSPDFISAFLLFASFYFIVEKPMILPVCILFLLSIITRADNILLCIVVISFLAFSGKWVRSISLKYYLIILACLLCCYYGVVASVSSYGWNRSFYPTFFGHLHLDHSYSTTFSLKEYIALLYSKAIIGVISSHLTIFLLLEIFLLKDVTITTLKKLSFNQLFSALLVGIIFIRFILFPDISDRFYIAFYLFIIIAFVINYSNNILEKKTLVYE